MFNYSLQWAWEKVITKEQGPICFCHSDIFLMEPINLSNYLLDKPLCFLPLSELSYIWEAMLLADIPKLPLPETMLWFPGVVKGSGTTREARHTTGCKLTPKSRTYTSVRCTSPTIRTWTSTR